LIRTNSCSKLALRFIDITAVDPRKKVLGTHTGAELFTMGQKCRIGGCAEKYYVVKKKVRDSGDVLVAPGQAHPSLYSEVIRVEWAKFNWMSRRHLDVLLSDMKEKGCGKLMCTMRYRHQQKPIACMVSVFVQCADESAACAAGRGEMTSPLPLSTAPQPSHSSTISSDWSNEEEKLVLRIDCLDGPVRAAATGQILALYSGDQCLGGGPIHSTFSSFFDDI
jgi:tRNA U34 2-thiouridine synthase MnmA/TrmU